MEQEVETRSTINEYVKRFREAPPAPSSERYNPAHDESLHCDWFWWLPPKAPEGVDILHESNVETEELSASDSDTVSVSSLRHRGNDDFSTRTDELLKKCDMLLQNHSSCNTERTQHYSIKNGSGSNKRFTSPKRQMARDDDDFEDCGVDVSGGMEDLVVSPWVSLNVHELKPSVSTLHSSYSYTDDTKSPHKDELQFPRSIGTAVDNAEGLVGSSDVEEGNGCRIGQNKGYKNDSHDKSDEVFAFLRESSHSSIGITSSGPPGILADNAINLVCDEMVDHNNSSEFAKGSLEDTQKIDLQTPNFPDKTMAKSNEDMDHRIKKNTYSELISHSWNSDIVKSIYQESSVASSSDYGDIKQGDDSDPTPIHPIQSMCSVIRYDVVERFLDDEVVSALWTRLQSVRDEISRHQQNDRTCEV